MKDIMHDLHKAITIPPFFDDLATGKPKLSPLPGNIPLS